MSNNVKKELVEKCREQYKDVPHEWKVAVIKKVEKDPTTFIDVNEDIDWLYDECIYYLFLYSTIRIKNLSKEMGYSEIPCETCRNIIKNWDKKYE